MAVSACMAAKAVSPGMGVETVDVFAAVVEVCVVAAWPQAGQKRSLGDKAWLQFGQLEVTMLQSRQDSCQLMNF